MTLNFSASYVFSQEIIFFFILRKKNQKMAIKSDQWIKKMAEGHGMIEPFVEHQVRHNNGNDLI